ncbi:MAG: hypothetical protein V4446_01385 [Pseudomonadota bacterium]
MTTTVKLNGTHLVQPMVQDLRAEGVPPVVALERALEAHIFEKFREGLGDRLVKFPVVRLHTMYFKDKYAALPTLTSTGYETWYTQVHFATRPGDEIKDLQIVANGINLIPIDYGSGVHRKVQTKISPLKRQTNHEFRINHLHVPGRVFQEVLNRLAAEGELQQPLIANFTPGPDIVGYHAVSYDHILTGSQRFCSCARPFHAHMLTKAAELVSQYVPKSWPEVVIALLKKATYEQGICHLCLARSLSSEEAIRRYGVSIETCFEAFVDQVRFDRGVDKVTARAEVMHVLGLSRWVREAALYGVIRDIFPDQRVLREASPEWLGRMRIDIYLPELNLAIEHQGEQHYRPIAVFGGEEAHARVLERDVLKRRLCLQHGVTVIDVRYDAPITKAGMRQRLRGFFTVERRSPPD